MYDKFNEPKLALKALKEKIEFDDQLNDLEEVKAISELETKYQTELKDAEIKNLGQQQKINALEIENKQSQINKLVSLLIIAASIILVILFIAKMRELRKTKQKNESLKLAIEKQHLLEKELTDVRDNIAQDFHDDLGNKLARISLLSAMVDKDISKGNIKIKSKIKQITDDANGLYAGTRDFIFSLKSKSDYLEELVTYLSDFGEEYFSKTDIKFVLDKDIGKGQKLPFYWSKQLVFIFKEALTNTLKHSKCNEVKLRFTHLDDVLVIECIDDGIGLKDSAMNSSNGLLNMEKRALKMGGKMEFDNEEGKGTVIRFIGETT